MSATEDLATLDSESQIKDLETADRTIPGATLGGNALPADVRFVIKQGQGSRVQSVDGRWYIDYVGGAGANILGHGHPHVIEAVQAQISKGLHFYGTLNEGAIALADKLVSLIPCAERVCFTTTGSESTFYAMRMARAFTGKNKILKFEGAYHGNHDYASFSLFPNKPANYPVAPADSGGVPEVLQPLVLVAPFNDLEAVRRLVEEHKDDLAAIIVEGVQRIIIADQSFLQGLREICDEYGLVYIFDEVVSGFRLALGGAQELFGVTPDLATYGKIVGGGGPLGAVAGKAEILDCVDPRNKNNPSYAFINGTLHGNPVAAAAGYATLEVLEEEGFYSALEVRTASLMTAIQEILDRKGIGVIATHCQSFWHLLGMEKPPRNQVDIMRSNQDLAKRLDIELIRQGCYVLPSTRRFVPSVLTDEDVTWTLEAFETACDAL